LSLSFVLELLLKHISICGNKNIFQNKTMERELLDVRFSQDRFFRSYTEKSLLKSKTGYSKINAGLFHWDISK